ncbi:MAG: 5-formyltetrahydrofolate cyclo-ligase [Pyrinomonadaceae bacterium]
MIKDELRKIYLARQRNLAFDEHLEKSRRVARSFFQNFDLKDVRFLHSFLPIEKNREIETWQIIQKIWQSFPLVKTLAARVDFEKTAIENFIITSDTKFFFNKWQILEPEGVETVEAEKIDVILVPLLAFDEKGFRVGYGKGFYDRFLGLCRPDALKIGLSYFPPIEKIADLNEFDVKLDFCVTPDAVFSFKE